MTALAKKPEPSSSRGSKGHAYEFGIDSQEITNWQWPF
jgi:hypothetical protein